MSFYDELNFKSNYENTNKQLPTKEIVKDFGSFKEEFIDTFNNVKLSEIKSMIYLNPKEDLKFDFIYDNQDTVGIEFFNKEKLFDEKWPISTKMEYLVDFIETTYDLVTPKTMKKIFEELLAMGSLGLTEEDYENMIFYSFNKYQINLKDPQDKNVFKRFLISSMEQESAEINNMLPSHNTNNINSNKNVNMKKESDMKAINI
jgi:hypothetical protein